MSALLPAAVYGLEVPAGDVMIPAVRTLLGAQEETIWNSANKSSRCLTSLLLYVQEFSLQFAFVIFGGAEARLDRLS